MYFISNDIFNGIEIFNGIVSSTGIPGVVKIKVFNVVQCTCLKMLRLSIYYKAIL